MKTLYFLLMIATWEGEDADKLVIQRPITHTVMSESECNNLAMNNGIHYDYKMEWFPEKETELVCKPVQ